MNKILIISFHNISIKNTKTKCSVTIIIEFRLKNYGKKTVATEVIIRYRIFENIFHYGILQATPFTVE